MMKKFLIVLIFLIPLHSFALVKVDSNGSYEVTSVIAFKGLAVIGNADGQIRVIDAKTSEVKNILKGHRKKIISFSADRSGKLLASLSVDDIIILWDMESGREIKRIAKLGMGVRAITLSQNGRFLYIAFPNTIQEYDTSSWVNTNIFEGYSDGIYSMAINKAGDLIATGGKTGSLNITDINRQEIVATFNDSRELISSVSFAVDSDMLITGSYDNIARLYTITRDKESYGKLEQDFSFFTDAVKGVSLDSYGKKIALASADGSVVIYDRNSGSVTPYYSKDDKGEVTAMAVDSSFSYIVYGKGTAFEEERYGVIRYIQNPKIYRKVYSYIDSDLVISESNFMTGRGNFIDKISAYSRGEKDTPAEVMYKYFKKDKLIVGF